RGDGVVGHRQDAWGHAEPAPQLVGDVGQGGAGGEPGRSVQVRGQVEVAQAEPRPGGTEGSEPGGGPKGLVLPSPPPLPVPQAGRRFIGVGTDLAHRSRRALARAHAGKVLSLDETEALLLVRGDALVELMSVASRLRDLGHGTTVTYSRKVFVPLTMLCRDHCHYCTFAKPPARLESPFLTPDEVVAIAEAGRKQGCKEALFTLGDRPEDRYPVAREWLEARGYASTLDYLRAVSIRVIEETGLLPHLNPGVMSWEAMARLKHVSASMGIMLETSSQRLSERGGPHFGSPDKVPAVRLRTIEDAGRLSVPFTTGILIGIGETARERGESLLAIRELHRKYRHIQEIIVQNFRAKPGTAMHDHPEPD